MTQELLNKNKLSIKILMGGNRGDNGKTLAQDILNKNGGKDTKLFTVYGRAEGIIVGQSTFGEFQGLVGTFYAKSDVTGEIYTAPKMFLTKDFQNQIKAKLEQSPGATVEFQAELFVCKDDSTSTGYFYAVRPTKTEEVKSFELKALQNLGVPFLLGNG